MYISTSSICTELGDNGWWDFFFWSCVKTQSEMMNENLMGFFYFFLTVHTVIYEVS